VLRRKRDWQPTSLTQPVRQLFAPAGGPLFASTDDAFLRSDDAGASWGRLRLPPASSLAALDTTDPRILYAAGADGLYRTDDGASTWQPVLQYEVGFEFSRLAVSAADHDRLYLALKQAPGPPSVLRLLRSRDGGRTWHRLQTTESSLCGWSVLLLQPHPTNADGLFQTTACLAGRTFGACLEHSADGGASWLAVFNPEPHRTLALGYPSRLVVGRDNTPGRSYLATNRDGRLGGSALVRSDDDANTWTEVLVFEGGGTPGYRQPEDPPGAPNVRIGGLAIDDVDPDHVYVGLRVYDQYPPRQPVGGWVLVSTDGGASWAELGRRDLGGINDLALSPATHSLYAATGRGLWRLDLAAAAAA
jgi:photosystem II stability/assembly factor-like uncharacterized protein